MALEIKAAFEESIIKGFVSRKVGKTLIVFGRHDLLILLYFFVLVIVHAPIDKLVDSLESITCRALANTHRCLVAHGPSFATFAHGAAGRALPNKLLHLLLIVLILMLVVYRW